MKLSTKLKDSFSNVSMKIPIGCDVIDRVLLGGGIPIGRVVELSGYEGTGKSELLQIFAKAIMENKGTATIHDVEVAYDADYILKKGKIMENLNMINPDNLEDCLEKITNEIEEIGKEVDKQKLQKAKSPSLIGVDSIAVLGVGGVDIKNIVKQKYAKEAKVWADWYRMGIPKKLMKASTVLVLTNQTRVPMDAGFILPDDKLETFAGKATRYLSSLRLYIKKGATIKQNINGVERKVGFDMKIRSIKSRLEKPNLMVRVPFYYGKGFDNELITMIFLIDQNIAKREGNKGNSKGYTIPLLDDKVTKKELIKKLREDKKFYKEVLKLIDEVV